MAVRTSARWPWTPPPSAAEGMVVALLLRDVRTSRMESGSHAWGLSWQWAGRMGGGGTGEATGLFSSIDELDIDNGKIKGKAMS
eukprot:scaffold15489_cov53-Attheya_sp.AAC.8